MNKVLAVFAKLPAPGRVKTRLAAATSDVLAAQVAASFLNDTLTRLNTTADERWLVHAPDDAVFTECDGIEADSLTGWQTTPQGPGDLGERMERFIRKCLSDGAKVVVLGSDSPTVPIEYVERAFRLLDSADVVLGPATDGGYYLLGIARRLPPIFDGIAWGTSAVLHETVARLDSSWKLALLPPWYDVDTLDDWKMLVGHLAAARRAGDEGQFRYLERLLENWRNDAR